MLAFVAGARRDVDIDGRGAYLPAVVKPRAAHRSDRGRNAPNGRASKRRRHHADVGAFALYVEGPSDHDLLSTWARRVDPKLTRLVEESTTIMGGRQPARAIDDFRRRGGAATGLKGLVILDRDDQAAEEIEREMEDLVEDGLEFFIWGQRHIESYLLVPSALRRVLGPDSDAGRIEDIVSAELAPAAPGSLHAKRLLGPGGPLSLAFGAALRPGDIARAMRGEELHDDIHALFRQIARMAGITPPAPEVVVKFRGEGGVQA